MTAKNTTNIAGHAWYDLGSDVDWQEYGGMWGRVLSPAEDGEPELWVVIRFDPAGDDGGGYGCSAAGFEVKPSGITTDTMRYADVPADGRDEYDDPIPDDVLTRMKVAAMASYGVGRVHTVDALRRGDGSARHVRAECARMMMMEHWVDSARYPVRRS